MKKPYVTASYEVTMYELKTKDILTLSSDRENAYVPSDSIWEDFDFDDDDD